MMKRSQLFEWEHEPAVERSSTFMPVSLFGTLDAYRPTPPKSNPFAEPKSKASPLSQRGEANPRDRAISALTAAWVENLPEGLRPLKLCQQFPRLANRAALCWSDPTLLQRFLNSVLSDQRGGRKGFPPEVRNELMGLRQYAQSGMGKRPS